MKPWCIERTDSSIADQQQLLDVAIYFGAKKYEIASEYETSESLIYVGVNDEGETYISQRTDAYEDNLITYNQAFELVTGLKVRDDGDDFASTGDITCTVTMGNEPNVTSFEYLTVAELLALNEKGVNFEVFNGSLLAVYNKTGHTLKDGFDFESFKEAVTALEELK